MPSNIILSRLWAWIYEDNGKVERVERSDTRHRIHPQTNSLRPGHQDTIGSTCAMAARHSFQSFVRRASLRTGPPYARLARPYPTFGCCWVMQWNEPPPVNRCEESSA